MGISAYQPGPGGADSGDRSRGRWLGTLHGTSHAIRRGILEVGEEALGLLLPLECAGCARPDWALCGTCARLLMGGARRVESGVPRLDRMTADQILPVWSLAAYCGPVRSMIVGWKDRGRADLTPILGTLLSEAAATLAGALRGQRRLAPEVPILGRGAVGHNEQHPTGGGHLGPGPDTGTSLGIAVVPVPSSGAARRRRGREPVGELAEYVADGLRRGGVQADVARLLMQRSGVRDQVGLSGRERGRNLSRGVIVDPRALRRLAMRDCRQGEKRVGAHVRYVCFLVDDIVTTGASLAAAELALAQVGVLSLGALTVAATPSANLGTKVLLLPSRAG